MLQQLHLFLVGPGHLPGFSISEASVAAIPKQGPSHCHHSQATITAAAAIIIKPQSLVPKKKKSKAIRLK